MQHDLFGAPLVEEVRPGLLLTQGIAGYRQRTLDNAHAADLTVAIAADFTTHGERLTQRAAGGKFLAIPFGISVEEAALKIQAELQARSVQILNVAGNGLYTFKKYGHTQADVNQWLCDVFSSIDSNFWPKCIRSGGQTGMDWAALVCAIKLGIPAHGHFPAGFVRRNLAGQDYESDAMDIEIELRTDALELASL